jgi:hypothetical protein
MTKTMQGSPDGIQVNTYETGKVYDLPSSLAEVFLREGWAQEDKAKDRAPEVKADEKTDHATRKRTGDTGRGKKSSSRGSE